MDRQFKVIYVIDGREGEAHPENYDDMFAGYENDLNKAVALIEWQKQEIESLTIRMNAFGLAVKSLAEERGKYFLYKENGEVVPLTKQSEWISVDERLPGVTGKYICCAEDKNGNAWTMPAFWDLEMKLWFGEFGIIKNLVTHWMPLPEAPKMKGGGE